MNFLKNYKHFLLEASHSLVFGEKKDAPLFLSDRFKKILNRIDDKISNNIMSLEDSGYRFEISFVDVTDKIDEISFIPVSKIIVDVRSITNTAWTRNRGTMKIGRIIAKLFPNKYTQKDVENFVNSFKAIASSKDSDIFSLLELVDSYKIPYWYDQNKYHNDEDGSLGNSCMKYDLNQNSLYFYDEYVNTNLLILYSDESRKKIKGRAIVWKKVKDDNDKEHIFMDRIYTNYEFDEEIFKMYAKNNGWLYKYKQSLNTPLLVMENGNKTIKQLSTKLKYPIIDYDILIPYLDTFFFSDKKILTNYYDDDKTKIVLSDTDGVYFEYNKNYITNKDGYTYKKRDVIYCKYGDDYKTRPDTIYLKYLDEYAVNNFPDIVHSEYDNNFYFEKDCVKAFDEDNQKNIWIYKEFKQAYIYIEENSDIVVNKISVYLRKMGISKFSVNFDGSVDVIGDVYVTPESIKNGKLIVKFNNVQGSFICDSVGIKTLENFPKKVSEDFIVRNTMIKNLINGPSEVGYAYDCSSNYIESLEGAPLIIKGDFTISNNKLKTLKYAPNRVCGDFLASWNSLINLKYFPKYVGGNIKLINNELESLEGITPTINGDIRLEGNSKLTSLKPILTVKGYIVAHATSVTIEYYQPNAVNIYL